MALEHRHRKDTGEFMTSNERLLRIHVICRYMVNGKTRAAKRAREKRETLPNLTF